MGCYPLLQGIFPTQGSNPLFLSSALATDASPLTPPGKPNITLELILFNVLGLVFLETHPPVLEIFLNYFFGYILPTVFFLKNYLFLSALELTHRKRPWCWERLKAGREGDDRRWDGWTASPTQWTWVWVNSGSWWWRERPGVLQAMVSQRVRRD